MRAFELHLAYWQAENRLRWQMINHILKNRLMIFFKVLIAVISFLIFILFKALIESLKLVIFIMLMPPIEKNFENSDLRSLHYK